MVIKDEEEREEHSSVVLNQSAYRLNLGSELKVASTLIHFPVAFFQRAITSTRTILNSIPFSQARSSFALSLETTVILIPQAVVPIGLKTTSLPRNTM